MWRDVSPAGAAVADETPEIEEWVDTQIALRGPGGGKPIRVWGSNVQVVDLSLRSYGFTGRISFWVVDDDALGGEDDDEARTLLTGKDPIEIDLSLRSVRPAREQEKHKPLPLKLTAAVTGREIFEQGFIRTDKAAVLARRYTLDFVDPMRAHWGEHYPCELYTKKSFADVLELHRGQLFKLRCDSQVAKAQRPLIFLGHDPIRSGSLYDFLVWWADHHNAALTFDAAEKTYCLADRKAAAPRKGWLDCEDVARLSVRLPTLPRHQARVLNADTRGANVIKTTLTTALKPLYQDVLLREPVAAVCQERLKLETARLRERKDEVHLAFRRIPLVFPQPGDSLDLTKDPQWAIAGIALPAVAKAEELRFASIDLTLLSREQAFEKRPGGDRCNLHGRMRATLEPLSEVHVLLPPYAPPPEPRLVEGLIVSEVGTAKQETHDIATEEQTSLNQYRVKIPLWANQIVNAPFYPAGQPGHFYFPSYRDARVLLAISFDSAAVIGYVDWRTDGRLPKDKQGNQLLMGKAPDDSTALRFVYQNEQPVFTLQRLNKKDRQTLELHEGGLRIEVREEKGP